MNCNWCISLDIDLIKFDIIMQCWDCIYHKYKYIKASWVHVL